MAYTTKRIILLKVEITLSLNTWIIHLYVSWLQSTYLRFDIYISWIVIEISLLKSSHRKYKKKKKKENEEKKEEETIS